MGCFYLKHISQFGSFPQVGVKIENIWNPHLATSTFGNFRFCLGLLCILPWVFGRSHAAVGHPIIMNSLWLSTNQFIAVPNPDFKILLCTTYTLDSLDYPWLPPNFLHQPCGTVPSIAPFDRKMHPATVPALLWERPLAEVQCHPR